MANISDLDKKAINWLSKAFLPMARIAFFIIFFWFGLLKLLDLSPAGPIASTLADQTIGANNFDVAFKVLAVLECVIGILFLIPKAVRIVVPLLLLHMIVVCSPLLLLPEQAWQEPFVPTLEGQYIIKNAAIVALAIGVAAQTKPINKTKKSKR